MLGQLKVFSNKAVDTASDAVSKATRPRAIRAAGFMAAEKMEQRATSFRRGDSLPDPWRSLVVIQVL